ncbi:MAG: hypothetical protein V1267_03165, partial [Alphaproteobacteria bacterium]|nr:hypothetical protein [Alphaproteobacteria bacterium]
RAKVGAETAIGFVQRMPGLAQRAEEALDRLAAWDNHTSRHASPWPLLLAFAAGAVLMAILLTLM